MYMLFLHTRGATVRMAKKLAFFYCLLVLVIFFTNFATIENFFEKSNVQIILTLDATFVPNVTFLGPLSLRYCLEKKTVT